jgi:hypothetical protein
VKFEKIPLPNTEYIGSQQYANQTSFLDFQIIRFSVALERKKKKKGHYCFGCDNKLCGGLRITTCSCRECICENCWEQLWERKPTFELVRQKFYTKKANGRYVEYTKEVYSRVENTGPICCDSCGEEYEPNGIEQY